MFKMPATPLNTLCQPYSVTPSLETHVVPKARTALSVAHYGDQNVNGDDDELGSI